MTKQKKITIECGNCENKEIFDMREYIVSKWDKKKKKLVDTKIIEIPQFICANCFSVMSWYIKKE